MTKSDLVQRLAEANPHLHHRDAEIIVAAIFDEIAAALARGGRRTIICRGPSKVFRPGPRPDRSRSFHKAAGRKTAKVNPRPHAQRLFAHIVRLRHKPDCPAR